MTHDNQPDRWNPILVMGVVFFLVAAPISLGVHLLTAPAAAQAGATDNGPQTEHVKYVCGQQEAVEIDRAVDEPPVKPGNYATDVNLHNPSDEAVNVTVEASSSLIRGLGEASTFTLQADQSVQLDCGDIIELLGEPGVAADFDKGFVVIESEEDLEITGVYTSRATEVRRDTPDVGVEIELNTGYEEDLRLLLEDEDVDEDWVITQDPDRETPFNAVVVDCDDPSVSGAYPNCHDGRAPDDSRIISVDNSSGSGVDSGDTFTYVTQFELPNEAQNPGLEIVVVPDDRATFYLNGHEIGNTANTPCPCTITAGPGDGFVAGTNVLEVVVEDRGGVVTSLALNGTVTADISGDVGVGTGKSIDVEPVGPQMSVDVSVDAPGQDGDGDAGNGDGGDGGNGGDDRPGQGSMSPVGIGFAAGSLAAVLSVPFVRRHR